jgi:hypothetical protein
LQHKRSRLEQRNGPIPQMSKIGVTKIARKISKAGKNRGESLYANSQRTEIISWPDKPRKANSLVLWRIRTPRESERQRARANVRRAEVLDGVCVSMLAAARVPPSLWPPRSPPASPRAVWGSRTPGSGAGTLPLARNGGGFRQDVGPHFCGWGNRTVSARASGAERKPHNPRSEIPFARGISPLPAPWPERQKAPARPNTDSSACRFRLRFSQSLRGWACNEMRSAAPRAHDRRRVASSSFQRHIGCGWGLTSPIQAGSTPLHSSASR